MGLHQYSLTGPKGSEMLKGSWIWDLVTLGSRVTGKYRTCKVLSFGLHYFAFSSQNRRTEVHVFHIVVSAMHTIIWLLSATEPRSSLFPNFLSPRSQTTSEA